LTDGSSGAGLTRLDRLQRRLRERVLRSHRPRGIAVVCDEINRAHVARRLEGVRCRFDVIAVTLDAAGHGDIAHVRGAFDAIA